ncbi:hypothetical protein V5O48_012994 [Marasmius crinis-equi]|uniref:Cytochrome P450 n=1 Tax=Marasmius crinis-equi TaxID=585013 RepID=A0ABR3F1A3_9AGAR
MSEPISFLVASFDVTKVLYGLLLIFVVDRIVTFQRKRRSLSYLSGIRSPFSPMGPVGALTSTKWWQAALNVTWIRRSTLYKTHETITVVPWLMGAPFIYTSNLEVAKQIVSTRQSHPQFEKSPEMAVGITLYGPSMVSSDGDDWKKYRRISSPSFSNSLYQLVWDASLKTYRDMVSAEGWIGQKSVDIPRLQTSTMKFALIVLGICAFGFDFNWTAPPTAAEGEISVQEAMRIVIDSYTFLAFAPEWVKRLPFKSFRTKLHAQRQLGRFIEDQVRLRKEEIRGYASGESHSRKDVFSMLVQANESDENAKNKLTDREMIGNVFILLFAGHETTANTLAATLGFLSVYPDAQDEVLQQIIDVVGWDRDPTFADYNDLNKVLAAFFEVVRLFPPDYIMIRAATHQDQILDIPNAREQEGSTPCHIPKGVWADDWVVYFVDRNPRYFEDPEEYKPTRWHTTPNDSELFTAFSFGPRACIGRKFATTEAVCFLTMLLRDWKVEPLLASGESVGGWKGRVLNANLGLTLSAGEVPVRFVRRERSSR